MSLGLITGLSLAVRAGELLFGKKEHDPNTGVTERVSKGLLTSKTTLGGLGLLSTVITMAAPRALDGEWPALLLVLGSMICAGLIYWGRASADTPLETGGGR